MCLGGFMPSLERREVDLSLCSELVKLVYQETSGNSTYRRLMTIKWLRDATYMSLSEARKIVDSAIL